MCVPYFNTSHKCLLTIKYDSQNKQQLFIETTLTGRFLSWRHTVLWGPPELLHITQTRFRPFSPISCKQRRFHLFKFPIFNQQWWQVVQKFKKIRPTPNKANAMIYSDFHVHIPGGGRRLHIRPQRSPQFHWSIRPTAQPMLVFRPKRNRCQVSAATGWQAASFTDLQIAGQPGASSEVQKGVITGCQIDAIHGEVCIIPAVAP